ncbi:unnamed protein product [Soboliphyme baturini]|uniref:ThiF domain-containing protein n=1 Tax=Soboliphyme baturini TaxID=241478 RepID=A0A183IAX2_9BILA|nr:unnamed protein product [Soboliphyme baturini]
MDRDTADGITADEFRLYDRQIRLWGLDTQRKIRESSVLVCGLSGLGAEVAKNLMLAGVKSLTLMDSEEVTEADLRANFFLVPEDIGKNRATASSARCRELNPGVSVSVVTSPAEGLNVDHCRQFSFVCLMEQTFETIGKVNQVCRQAHVRFCSGNVAGYFGCGFFDFLEQTYRMAQTVSKDEVHEIGSVEIAEGTLESYHPLEHVLDVQWKTKKVQKGGRRAKMLSDSYFVFQVLFRFTNIRGSFPFGSQQDMVILRKLRDEVLAEFDKCTEKVEFSASFADYIFGQLSPVCAILGGFLASQIINAISEKVQPFNNAIFYDGFENNCQLLKLPLILQCKS